MNYFKQTPIHYRIILITAGVLASLFLFQAYMHHYVYADLKNLDEFNWWREAPVPYLNFLFWALLCPLVYMILKWRPFDRRPIITTLLTHLGLSVVIASFHEIVTSAIYYTILHRIGDFDLGDAGNMNMVFSALGPAIFTRTMEYWVLMGVMVALENVRLQRREHEQLVALQHDLQVSQLNALKKQLQPHFLFNTLNTVSALMDENISDARTVLSRLGQLLRMTLDKTQRDKVTLEREVDHIANYLGIESIRFRDRLQVEYDIPGELSELLVPSMVLQPLVENAIKHGQDATSEGVHILVKASKEGDTLCVEVRDNGKGCSDVQQALENGGIGLRNVKDRVALLYGEASSFAIASPDNVGFHVRIVIPLEQATEPPHTEQRRP